MHLVNNNTVSILAHQLPQMYHTNASGQQKKLGGEAYMGTLCTFYSFFFKPKTAPQKTLLIKK